MNGCVGRGPTLRMVTRVAGQSVLKQALRTLDGISA